MNKILLFLLSLVFLLVFVSLSMRMSGNSSSSGHGDGSSTVRPPPPPHHGYQNVNSQGTGYSVQMRNLPEANFHQHQVGNNGNYPHNQHSLVLSPNQRNSTSILSSPPPNHHQNRLTYPNDSQGVSSFVQQQQISLPHIFTSRSQTFQVTEGDLLNVDFLIEKFLFHTLIGDFHYVTSRGTARYRRVVEKPSRFWIREEALPGIRGVSHPLDKNKIKVKLRDRIMDVQIYQQTRFPHEIRSDATMVERRKHNDFLKTANSVLKFRKTKDATPEGVGLDIGVNYVQHLGGLIMVLPPSSNLFWSFMVSRGIYSDEFMNNIDLSIHRKYTNRTGRKRKRTIVDIGNVNEPAKKKIKIMEDGEEYHDFATQSSKIADAVTFITETEYFEGGGNIEKTLSVGYMRYILQEFSCQQSEYMALQFENTIVNPNASEQTKSPSVEFFTNSSGIRIKMTVDHPEPKNGITDQPTNSEVKNLKKDVNIHSKVLNFQVKLKDCCVFDRGSKNLSYESASGWWYLELKIVKNTPLTD